MIKFRGHLKSTYALKESFLFYLFLTSEIFSQQCTLNKQHSYTSLRVVFQGALRITGCTNCCKRWYFTFNGNECRQPFAIDAIIYHSANINIHRSTTVEGYCGGIGQGAVNVGFSVGNCWGGSKSGDAYTSWNSVSRIIIEEVPPPQS